jgi:hypothetical protein
MPSSGARSGTKPSRNDRGQGDGTVGATDLACGHATHDEHIVSGPSGKLWRCPEGCGLVRNASAPTKRRNAA